MKPILIARDWLVAAILAVVVVILWIGLGVYFTLSTTTITGPIAEQIKPLNPSLDEKVINELDSRIKLKNETLNEGQRIIFKPEL